MKIFATMAMLALSTSVLGDTAEAIDPKLAVEFVLKTCLPAMDDLANVEKMAHENNWFHLPTTVFDSKYTTAHLRWMVNGYSVITWSFKGGNLPSCFVGIRPYKKVDRNGFFDAISASLELKLISDRTFLTLRQETYEIIGDRPMKLLFSSINDGTMSAATIYIDGAPQ